MCSIQKILIRLECLGDYLSKIWHKDHRRNLATLEEEIRQNAWKAWQTRDPELESVRFMQKMPSLTGLHFRFLTVSEKAGKLIVGRA